MITENTDFSFINPEVAEVLKKNGLLTADAVGVLLCVHYGIKQSFVPPLLVNRILATGLIRRDCFKTWGWVWEYPLFENVPKGYDWISEWMDMFKKVNSIRRGNKGEVIRRFKKFFTDYPMYRQDDVIRATEEYLRTVTNAEFCKTSHKFIYERGDSLLLTFLENNKESKEHYTNNMI